MVKMGVLEKIVLPVILGSVLSACSSVGQSKWTKQDTMRQLTFAGVSLIDINQTKRWIDESKGRGEGNPFHPRYPSKRYLTRSYFQANLGNLGIAYLLPEKKRHIFQYGSILSEVYIVWKNTRKIRGKN